MKIASYMPEEPIVAIATALAPSAIAAIRVSGKNSIQLLSKVFSRPVALNNAAGYTMLHGWIVAPLLSENATTGTVEVVRKDNASTLVGTSFASNDSVVAGKTDSIESRRIDEVMLGVYRAPKSFTGEDMVEIFCHGGTSPVMAVLNLLLRNGFRQAERGEFTFRAYINGKTDLTRAEAVREIIDSKTDESRGRAAGRLSGNLFNEINRIKLLLVNTLGSIEAEVEYPEDEETISGSYDSTELENACRELEELASTWSSEKLYQDGARVVLCGRTNAGKSSLFNTLLKEERAIVSDIAGTTRDWLESWISFGGVPARLFDTAGLRDTQDVIEKSGVERSFDLALDADIILYLVDSVAGFSEEDSVLLSELTSRESGSDRNKSEIGSDKSGSDSEAEDCKKKIPVVLVWNKADKADKADKTDKYDKVQAVLTATGDTLAKNGTLVTDSTLAKDNVLENKAYGIVEQVSLSAKTGQGLSSLVEVVSKILLQSAGVSRTQAGLGSQRQKAAVDEALDSVRHALEVPSLGLSLDAVAQDLEDAIAFLGEITGEISPTDVLENIFSRFCVGK